MWVRIVQTFVYYTILVFLQLCLVQCHVPNYISTPSSKVEQHCILSESCVHDTIAVCGLNGDKKRSFLDLCDMLEFTCDTNQIYVHIDDEAGCPTERPRK
ncbi:unnamed protein product [Arctia plantaginis]|uniref:Kazal-like domain-containing protein n=1 Tax=Arctia plantaginis TaxID=874455 RepID=A0A8S1A1K2_ARCPL|nr:unnamed protein product [Arctia plantaginis]CAB3238308.1 unnamed protein product [Arctia plantaginis]